MTQPSVKTRRKFDETFKREAVQNWLSSGKSAEVIAQELGLKANRLYAWKNLFAPAAAGGRAAAGAKPGSLADLQGQLDAALRENRHLREQRDILKKTLGILSEPSPSAMNGLTR
jgi:transposase-like protein